MAEEVPLFCFLMSKLLQLNNKLLQQFPCHVGNSFDSGSICFMLNCSVACLKGVGYILMFNWKTFWEINSNKPCSLVHPGI